MSKDKKKSPIKAFIENLGNASLLDDTSFNDLYDWHFGDLARPLREQIIYNLSHLSESKFNIYIQYVKDELEGTYYYDPNNCIIQKWLDKFELIESDFPFYSDERVSKLISYNKNQASLEFEEAKMARSIQLEFLWYATFLEANKMIDFVNTFLINDLELIDSNAAEPKIVSELDNIFISEKGFEAFNYLLMQLGLNSSNVTKWGVQAKFNAIWGAPLSKKFIFKKHSQLKDYINFLNKTYNLSYKSRTMSDGYLYHDSIKNWLNEFYIE
jgi:hypothetical protein